MRVREREQSTDKLTLLKDHGHWAALVQDTQLALGGLGVCRVGEDTAVQESSVCVGNHGTNVTGGVRLVAILDGLTPLFGGGVPVLAVALVGGVDGPLLGHLHVGVGKDELAEGVVHGEAIDGTVLHGHDELSRGTVHGETSGNEVGTGAKEVLLGALGVLRESVDTENGSNRDTSVQVAGAINGVAGNSVLGIRASRELDGLVLLLGNENAHTAGRAHGGDENVIADHIQLFLVIAGRVGRACKTREVDQAGAADVVGD